MLPMPSIATQSVVDGQEMLKIGVEESMSTGALQVPSAGSVEVTMSPAVSAATQSALDGQETLQNWFGWPFVVSIVAGAPSVTGAPAGCDCAADANRRPASAADSARRAGR